MGVDAGYRADIIEQLQSMIKGCKDMVVLARHVHDSEQVEAYSVKADCASKVMHYMTKCPTANATDILREIDHLIQCLEGTQEDGFTAKMTYTEYKKKTVFSELRQLVIRTVEQASTSAVANVSSIYEEVVNELLKTEKRAMERIPKSTDKGEISKERSILAQTCEALIFLDGVTEVSDILFANAFSYWLNKRIEECTYLRKLKDCAPSMVVHYDQCIDLLLRMHNFLDIAVHEHHSYI